MGELHRCAAAGSISGILSFLHSYPKPDINTVDNRGMTPLHYSASNGHLNVSKLLLDHGAKVDARTQDGNEATPLHIAADHGRTKTAALLLDRGADVNTNAYHYYEGTPLHCAACRGRLGVVKLLLDHHAFINAKTPTRYETSPSHVTPLWCAIKHGHWEVEKYLRNADARISSPPRKVDLDAHARKHCPYCGKPLRTDGAKQCFSCHMDWHDPNSPVRHPSAI